MPNTPQRMNMQNNTLDENEAKVLRDSINKFKVPRVLNNSKTNELLKESIMTNGKYFPSDKFKEDSSVAIALGDKAILLMGWANDAEAHNQTDRLLANPEFANLVKYEYGNSDNLYKVVVANIAACPGDEYVCLAESKQGVLDNGESTGMVVAVLPDNNPSFGFGLCINSSLMLDIFPNAKPLSTQVILDAD